MTALAVTGLHRTFDGRPPVAALAGVDLDVNRGELVAILGPSGCGKTTLLRMVAGFDRPDAGVIAIGERVVTGPGHRFVPPERRRVGIVPQEAALFPHLDVARNVGFGLTGLDRAERGRRIAELLELVGLAGYERRRPHELSGGQQQRVALARALAPQPELVLLDEPFAALDASLRTDMRDDVARLLRHHHATAILVTHDRAEAMAFADSVAVMRAGTIRQRAEPAALYRRPRDLDVARSTGDVVVLRSSAAADRGGDGSTVETGLGTVRLRAARTGDAGTGPGAAAVAIRPEQVVLTDGPAVATVAWVRFEGPIVSVGLRVDGDGRNGARSDVDESGGDGRRGDDVGDGTLTARWPSSTAVHAGDRVALAVAGDAIWAGEP